MRKKIVNKGVLFQDRAGFTLIEILVVVILLGILATIIVPQVSVSSEDAKLNSLKTNLSNMRSAVELYYYQHENSYPGDAVPTTKPDGVTTTADAFVAQLTRYTDKDGNISNSSGTSEFPYGPYIKALPTNTYNQKADVTIDNSTTDITTKASGGVDTAWKFYTKTGVLMAADGEHDAL
jgi:prepilin-type N-terminal cleavage/methylation domain-containing protein